MYKFPDHIEPKITVAIPFHINPATVRPIWVAGDALSGRGINSGDIILCVSEFNLTHITPDKICLVAVKLTGELLLRSVEFLKKGRMLLRAYNPAYPDRNIKCTDVELKGVAEAVQKLIL